MYSRFFLVAGLFEVDFSTLYGTTKKIYIEQVSMNTIEYRTNLMPKTEKTLPTNDYN